MGLLDIFKKKPESKAVFEPVAKAAVSNNQTVQEYMESQNINSFNEPLDKLVDGDLPWGWIYQNKDFIDKISNEYSYFLHIWVNSRNDSPKQLYAALKSFVLYIEDVEELCKSKGECFEFWFYKILCSKDYIATRKQELYVLEANLDAEQANYEKKQMEAKELKRKSENMKPKVIELLKINDGILQSDFWKLFDDADREAVSDIVYSLLKEGKLDRTKSGRSFILHLKE